MYWAVDLRTPQDEHNCEILPSLPLRNLGHFRIVFPRAEA